VLSRFITAVFQTAREVVRAVGSMMKGAREGGAATYRHGLSDQGWNRHPAPEDGWEEISASLPLPYRSILDVSVTGLPADCPVKVLVDDRLIGEGRGQVGSRTWVDRGSRRVAIQWLGRDLPTPALTAEASHLRTVAELEQEHPELHQIVMKHQNPARFVLCRMLIVSFPARKQTPVYGIFTIDKVELQKRPHGDSVVKQDFLVYDATDRAVTYYSGQGTPGDTLHGTIDDLCARFGEPHFGCKPITKTRWDCGDHHHPATGPKFREPSLVAAIQDGLKQAAAETGVDLSALGLT
jgi:hypothetical protein